MLAALLLLLCISCDQARKSGRNYEVLSRNGDANKTAVPQPPPPPKTPSPSADSTATNFNTEDYDNIVENKFLSPLQNPLSTFSIDVDEASYSNVRRYLQQGSLPPAGAVRIEEMFNYFDYDYPKPTGEEPFSVITEMADCPWNHNTN